MADSFKYKQNLDRGNIFSGNVPVTTSGDWDFTFTSLPKIFDNFPQYKSYLQTLFGDGTQNTANKFRLHTDSLMVPESNLTPQPIVTRIRGFQQTQVGGDISDSGSVTFVVQDFMDMDIQKFITTLAYLSSDPRTKQVSGSPLAYAFDCNITQLDPNQNPLKRWVCEGCNLINVSHGTSNFDSSYSGHQLTQVSFSVDHYEIFFNTATSGESWSALGTSYTN